MSVDTHDQTPDRLTPHQVERNTGGSQEPGDEAEDELVPRHGDSHTVASNGESVLSGSPDEGGHGEEPPTDADPDAARAWAEQADPATRD
jgi:hypothetical protein